jgi:hypothetical protein
MDRSVLRTGVGWRDLATCLMPNRKFCLKDSGMRKPVTRGDGLRWGPRARLRDLGTLFGDGHVLDEIRAVVLDDTATSRNAVPPCKC